MQFANLHSWDLTPQEGIQLQRELVQKLKIVPLKKKIRWIAGTDVSYTKGENLHYAGVILWDCQTGSCVEFVSHVGEMNFPYISGLLSFREIPLLLEAFKKLTIKPDVVICDGQGIAHPRGLGLAAHLGLWLQIPTIGCAKNCLVGDFVMPEMEKGSESALTYKGSEIGKVVRSKKGIKPLFISPGHLCDLKRSVELVKECLGGFRLPEPTRLAHNAVNHLRLETSLLI